jgi:hypothetical protein
VRFAGASLAVREEADVVAVERGLNDFGNCVKDLLLARFWA